MTLLGPDGAPLKIHGVRVVRVEIEGRVHVELAADAIPDEWLAANRWTRYQRLRAVRGEWWDVTADGLRMRFELAYAEPRGKTWRLRFSSATPNHAAVALAHRVGQVAHEVTVRRGPVSKQVTLEERRAKQAGPKRVTVEVA